MNVLEADPTQPKHPLARTIFDMVRGHGMLRVWRCEGKGDKSPHAHWKLGTIKSPIYWYAPPLPQLEFDEHNFHIPIWNEKYSKFFLAGDFGICPAKLGLAVFDVDHEGDRYKELINAIGVQPLGVSMSTPEKRSRHIFYPVENATIAYNLPQSKFNYKGISGDIRCAKGYVRIVNYQDLINIIHLRSKYQGPYPDIARFLEIYPHGRSPSNTKKTPPVANITTPVGDLAPIAQAIARRFGLRGPDDLGWWRGECMICPDKSSDGRRLHMNITGRTEKVYMACGKHGVLSKDEMAYVYDQALPKPSSLEYRKLHRCDQQADNVDGVTIGGWLTAKELAKRTTLRADALCHAINCQTRVTDGDTEILAPIIDEYIEASKQNGLVDLVGIDAVKNDIFNSLKWSLDKINHR